MIAIAIKDLKLRLSNSNLPIGKNAVCFESLAQKENDIQQMVGILYDKNYDSVL